MALPASTMADEYKVTEPTTLTWVAGGVGGGWYVQAGGIARMIAEAEPNLILKVIPGGGVVNPVRVSNHKDDLGWGITFVDKMAFKGLAPVYKNPNPDVRAMGGIFGIYHIHVLGAANEGITTMAQLADHVKNGGKIKLAAPMKGTSDLPLMKTILDFTASPWMILKTPEGKYSMRFILTWSICTRTNTWIMCSPIWHCQARP